MYSTLRHIIIPISACLFLSACESDSPDQGQGSAMQFAVSDISRASVTTNLNTTGAQFSIYGDMKFKDHNSTTIFDKTSVTYNNNSWNYGATQYWFPQHEHSFIAIHPSDVDGMTDSEYSDSRLSFTYTLPDNFAAANDLMVATHRRLYNDISSPATPVTLKFSHIMSRIDFVLKNDMAADFVRVKEIKLEGINSKGSFTILPAPIISGAQTDDYSSSWTDISNKVNLNAKILVDIPENKTGSLFPDNNALFMIPQPDNKDVMMEISYELWDDGEKFEEHTLTATTPIGGWESGKVYTYSITISEITKEIYLTVSVKPWHPEKNAGIVVPES